LGCLVLLSGPDTIVNVRGSSDTPALLVNAPRKRRTDRETVLHYPLPTAVSLGECDWCVVAPILRSGRVWDWVRNLRYPDGDAESDSRLEALAVRALKRRLRAPTGSVESAPLKFVPALGGERAPDWDPRATGSITGLIESHDIGDIALAAVEGMSAVLRACIGLMEQRYETTADKLIVVGGPARNALWNWVTGIFTQGRRLRRIREVAGALPPGVESPTGNPHAGPATGRGTGGDEAEVCPPRLAASIACGSVRADLQCGPTQLGVRSAACRGHRTQLTF